MQSNVKRSGRFERDAAQRRWLVQYGADLMIFHLRKIAGAVWKHEFRAGRTVWIMLMAVLGLAASEPASAASRRIIVLGDSLSAGFNLAEREAFPAVLERRLKARGDDVIVINAGVSGDTASGGLARLEWALGEGADLVIVELGANDMLRGVDPAATRKALDAIVERLQARKIRVLLAGMKASPNLGQDYAKRFDAIYPDIAAKRGVILYPFFLEGVAAQPALNLPDGMHPNAKGVEAIVDRILPLVDEALK